MNEYSQRTSSLDGEATADPAPQRQVARRTNVTEPGHSPSDDETTLAGAERTVLKQILRGALDIDATAEQESQETADTASAAEELLERFASGVAALEQLSIEHRFEQIDRFTRRSAIVLLRHKTASKLTIVFNGNQPLLAVPIPLLRRDTHILLIRDPRRCFGLAGLPGLGSTAEMCIATLGKLSDALGVEKTFCIGISAGGSTALKLGTDLKADGLLCFSAPTTLDLGDDPGAELIHYPQLTQLYKTDRRLGIDLAAHYRKAVPRPGLLMVYGAGHARDSWLAERIATVNGAEMFKIDDFDGHKTYPLTRQRGLMPGLLDRLFQLKAVS